MSYPYPPMPPHGSDMEMPHPGYIQNYSVPSQRASLGTSNMQELLASSKESEASVKTPFPTPSARPPQQPTPETQTAADKKRNKLGYHRISLACGHCRRRKIRCIPTPSDTQGRCVNCIRLKKDCSFYPVDQPPAAASSRASPGPKGTSESSSPATSNGVPAEPSINSPFSPLMMQQVPSMAPPILLNAVTAETVSPEARVPSNVPTSRPYNFAGQPGSNWIPADAGQSPNSKPGDLNMWRSYPPESPVSSQFSPYSHGPPSSTAWTSAGSDPSSRDGLSWGNYPPPVRSMSYGGEPLAGHHPTHYPPMPHGRQFDRRSSAMSDAYTPSVVVEVHSMDIGNTAGMDQLVPLSAGAVPPPNFEGWHQQHQQPSNLPYSKPGDTFGNWGLGGNGGGQPLHTHEPGPHNEPNPADYYARR